MDRAQPGARGSTNRNIEFGETTGQYTDGWIVPADEPTLSAQRYTSLDETAFNEFDASYSADSLTVTIDPGEAFVDGWLARDTTTELTLESNTLDQLVVLGWNPDAIYDETQHETRDEADQVLLDLKSNVEPDNPHTPIWGFDTDGSGVISVHDLRDIGRTMYSVNTLYDTKSTGSIDNLGQNVVSPNELNIPSLIVKRPDRLPITELDDGDSIEIPLPVADDRTVEVFRWGAFDASTGSTVSGLVCQLLDGSDTVQTTANTANRQNTESPLTSQKNTSGNQSVFKLRAKNDSGTAIDSPGVGAVFGYRVI